MAEATTEPASKLEKKRRQRLRQIKEGKKRAVDQEAAAISVAAGLDDDRMQEESSSVKVNIDQAVQEHSTTYNRRDARRTIADFWPGINVTESKEANAKLSPVFSKDGRFCFVASGRSIHVYSTSTSRLVSTLEPPAVDLDFKKDKRTTGDAIVIEDEELADEAQEDRGRSASSKRPLDWMHSDKYITGVFVNPSSHFQLITTSWDGCVRIWDFLEGVLLRTIYTHSPIIAAALPPITPGSAPKNALYLLSAPTTEGITPPGGKTLEKAKFSKSAGTFISRISLKRGAIQRKRLGRAPAAHAMDVASNGKYIVAISRRKIYIFQLERSGSPESEGTRLPIIGIDAFDADNVHDEQLTRIAIHPNESYFVTGSNHGQIRLWYMLNPQFLSMLAVVSGSNADYRRNTSKLHWHAHAVTALAFTPNGAYLLSGGEEATLVVWQIESKHQEFIPRLGAPISAISVENFEGRDQEFVTRLSDGSIVFVGAGTLKPSRRIAGAITVSQSQHAQSAVLLPLAVEPITNNLVYQSGYPSSLQFYSPTYSAVVHEQEIAPSNRVSRTDERLIEPIRVEQIAFCRTLKQETWMATFDTWQDHEYTRQSHLKFWLKQDGSSSYSLRTRIDLPHGTKRLTSLAFAQVSENDEEEYIPRLATTSMDGVVKLWTYRILDTKTKASVTSQLGAWMCISVMSYRDMAAVDCSFSADGSTLAIAHVSSDESKGIVSLWNSDTGDLMQTLPARNVTDNTERKFGEIQLRALCNVRFIGQGRHTKIIAAGLAGIRAWSAISLAVIFDEAYQASHLLADPIGQSERIVLVRGRRCKILALGKEKLEVLGSYRLPVDSYTLPLHMALAYPLPSSIGTTEEATFAVAAISQTGAVVLSGPSDVLCAIQPHTTHTGNANNIRTLKAAPQPSNTRLFEEIFGPSTTLDEPVEPTTIYDVTSSVARRNADEQDLFDKQPTHLMPLVSTMWKELLMQTGGLKSIKETAEPTCTALTQVNNTKVSKREQKRQARTQSSDKRVEQPDNMNVDGPSTTTTNSQPQKQMTYVDEIPGIDELFKEIFIIRQKDEASQQQQQQQSEIAKEKHAGTVTTTMTTTPHHPLLGQVNKASPSMGRGPDVGRKSSSSSKKAKKRESGNL